MKKILLFTIMAALLFISSCEIDNYDPPTMTLDGKVTDQVTGENIFTRQPNGIKVRLLEEGYSNPVPYDFWVKPDGTFRNTKLFPAKYKVSVLEGAFEQSSAEEQIIDLSRNQTIEFKVEPYIRITGVSISVSGNTVRATYGIQRTASTNQMVRSLLILAKTNILHENTVGLKKSAENTLSEMTEQEILSKTFVDEISNLPAGVYYARVAVFTQNYLNRYNYSEIVKVTVN
ncbi:MAG: DUF3823 domain-containing protein [Bacteroidales bacterium]|jgi:hypothetical protein|nr:DUF3823 domain-containing protein [Bacteroidales bacterium]